MNPVEFREIGRIAGLVAPDDSHVAQAAPAECPRRAAETSSLSGTRYAQCELLSKAAGRSVGVDEATCRVCICNGPADASKNPALRKHICQVAWSSTIAGELALEPLSPSDEEVSTAVENVKRWLGDDMARRFIDALVYHESVTPEKGAELAAGLGAVS